ncbi:MAG TPA: hypothetical protein VK095_01710 [Beutenbergiaceae bacterium]|nr:hypothetical protein [Beutenbergiaceae bacterium]
MTASRRTTSGDPVTRDERIAAARVIVAVNERLGTQTEQWIIDLANEDRDRVSRGA